MSEIKAAESLERLGRRGFLKLFGKATAIGLVAAAMPSVLDPEKLLWSPEDKTIFLPPAMDYTVDLSTGNSFLSADTIAREVLMILENNLMFANSINRAYNSKFVNGARIDETINIRTSQRFRGDGPAVDALRHVTRIELKRIPPHEQPPVEIFPHGAMIRRETMTRAEYERLYVPVKMDTQMYEYKNGRMVKVADE